MFDGDASIYLIYALAALAAIIVAETVFLSFSAESERRETVNRRMYLSKKTDSQREVLQLLRKERDGSSSWRWLSLQFLHDLRAHSGMKMPLWQFLSMTTAVAVAAVLLLEFKGYGLSRALPTGLSIAVVLPYKLLKFLKNRRLKQFGIQLPEALSLITRGLKAGHPVPVAVAMVGREMPDPIGSEFGLVADEITYGSDMVTALQAMYRRVGHEDLPLFVTAVGIQATSGGNLREILDGLAHTIRERGKLRRKVRAISAEGRISAYILTAVPVLLMTFILVFMPFYYADSWDNPLTWYLLGGTVAWGAFGNFIMFKMANFKY